MRPAKILLFVCLMLTPAVRAGDDHKHADTPKGDTLRVLVFGVGVRDPLAYGLVAGLVIGVAAVACLIPGRRATRVNPVDALRAE